MVKIQRIYEIDLIEHKRKQIETRNRSNRINRSGDATLESPYLDQEEWGKGKTMN